ncbi:hypothetical protein GCM10010313_26840 [Streptomyces violarus]|uniref:Uncharacterized protein n=1 Tax=Streptomyces violarus TaxID=67380 RepID=A0A7W4ZYF0_9ACTN|nr:hypothetical protein [Streptomyces violarus]MBB3080890.1 hypothetical protein [Streptomyces violarus]GHD07551.1 hypothetical protein GCM10010313_26840 [Streptomyces violarus]
MVLATKRPGRARLEAGHPWSLQITYAQGRQEVRLSSGEEAPTWDEIDRCLAEKGFDRTGTMPCRAPEAGDEFDVVGWSSPSSRRSGWREEDGERNGPQYLTVALPVAEVGEIRRALDALHAHSDRPRQTAAIAALIEALDAVDTVPVTLPAASAKALHHAVSVIGYWTKGLEGDTLRVAGDLCRYLSRSQPTIGPWPHIRDALQDSLREALSRPGAEGLAARDELLAVLRSFTHAHQTATRADDTEQRRLQMERLAAEPGELQT